MIFVLDASVTAPVAVAFLDMNGLKALNDRHGHDAGDRGLRAYFQAVSSVLGDNGQAYRLGGDEVLVVLPASDTNAAVRTVEAAARRLMREHVVPNDQDARLSVSAGIVTVDSPGTAPADVRKNADAVQYRAKEVSRKKSPRPSVIATESNTELKVITPGEEP